VRRPRVLPLLAALAALVALLPVGPLAVRAAAIGVTWLLTPGLLLASRLATGEAPAWRALLALSWSPLIAGGLTALLAALGLPVPQAARLTAATIGAAALVDAFLAAPSPDPARAPGAARASRAPWWIAGAGALIVLGLHLLRPALSQRSDGAFHTAVTLSVLRTGVPPEDPFFAGLRLLYFWGTHVWSAGWLALAPGLAPWTPFVALSVSATVVALLGIGLLALRLGGGTSAVALAGAIAFFGSAPFSWVWVLARSSTGDVRGIEEVRRLLGNGVDAAFRVMSPGLLHPSLVLPADKFIVVTPFALGIGCAVALVLALLRVVERPGVRTAAVLALLVVAALFAHPVAAAATVASGSLAWLLLVDRAVGREPGARAAAIGSALAIGLGCAVALPYLLEIESGAYSPGLGFGAPALGARALWSLTIGGALVVPAAGWWLGKSCTKSNERAVLLAIGAILATGALFFEMRGDNQSKLLNLLFFLLSPAAAMGWAEAYRRSPARLRPLVPAILVVAAVPTLLCCAWAYTTEGPGSTDVPPSPGPGAAALLARVPHLASPRAVLVDGTMDTTSRVASASPRLADRPLLWGGWYMARKWGYPMAELTARERAAHALAAGRAGGADSLLRTLGRDVWVLRDGTPADADAFRSPRWHAVEREGDFTLYRLDPEAR
jgi:hypothetical protein